MLLACPHCGYPLAPIVPAPTASLGPSPRCPRCDGAVEPPRALDGATDEAAADVIGASLAASIAADDASAEPGDAPAPSTSPPDSPAPAPEPDAAATHTTRDRPIRAARTRPMPSFVRGDALPRVRRRSWPWYAALVALGLMLALQLLLAQRHELAASTRWRPWVEALCDALPCAIPAWHEPAAFTMLSRSVQPSRTQAGVLVIEASFRNDARWPQRWPTLVLSLADVEGRDVGARAFAPSEYRPGRTDTADQLAPGQSATVQLQVREPAPDVVAFTFDFQ